MVESALDAPAFLPPPETVEDAFRDVMELVPALLFQKDLIEPDAVSLWPDVEFPNRLRLIAGVAEALRECRDFRHRHPIFVGAVPVSARTHSGHQ